MESRHLKPAPKPSPMARAAVDGPPFTAIRDLLRRRSNGRPRMIPRGMLVYAQADASDAVYLLVSGQIKLSRLSPSGREVLLDIVEPGGFFGLFDVLSHTRRRASAAALESSRVLGVDAQTVRELLAGIHPATRDLIEISLRSLRRMERRVESLMTEAGACRLGRNLLELVRTEAARGRVVGLTHQELASLVGTSRETVSLLLARFRGKGWVATERGRVRLLDESGLAAWLREMEVVLGPVQAEA